MMNDEDTGEGEVKSDDMYVEKQSPESEAPTLEENKGEMAKPEGMTEGSAEKEGPMEENQ